MTPRRLTLNIDRIVMDRRDFSVEDLSAAISAHVTDALARGEVSAAHEAPFRTVRSIAAEPIKGRATAGRVGAAVARAALGTVRR